jgi:predicted transcriptional regulator
MGKQALNTYLDPGQKQGLERIARRRKVSQAAIVREAVDEYVRRHDSDQPTRSVEDAWAGLLGGYYSGDGRRNDHNDIYR